MPNVPWVAPTALEVRAFASKLNAFEVRAVALDVRAHCFRFDEASFHVQVRVPLEHLLHEVRELVAEINARCDPPRLAPAPQEPESDWFEQSGSLIPPGMEAQLWKRVGDACFAARHELRAQEISPEGQERDFELARADSMRRRLRRALSAVLRALLDAQPGSFLIETNGAEDLESSIAVRAAYARFRRALPPCEQQEAECLSRSLRLCAVSFAVLFGSLEAGDLRVRDQRLLRSLQDRLFSWAQGTRDTLEGMRLYRDIVSTAELLRAINMRQELRANDAALMSAALSKVPDVADELAVRAWIGGLAELRGRDDDLDRELIAASSHRADPRVRVEAICRCLQELSRTSVAEAGTFF